jgi:hypothetical protein
MMRWRSTNYSARIPGIQSAAETYYEGNLHANIQAFDKLNFFWNFCIMTEPPNLVTTAEKDKEVSSLFKSGVLAKGIVTGVVVSNINNTGRSIMNSIIRHPLLMFGLGMATGYFAHRYRKEIISAAGKAADESKNFVLRQKENLLDLVAESREAVEEKQDPK